MIWVAKPRRSKAKVTCDSHQYPIQTTKIQKEKNSNTNILCGWRLSLLYFGGISHASLLQAMTSAEESKLARFKTSIPKTTQKRAEHGISSVPFTITTRARAPSNAFGLGRGAIPARAHQGTCGMVMRYGIGGRSDAASGRTARRLVMRR